MESNNNGKLMMLKSNKSRQCNGKELSVFFIVFVLLLFLSGFLLDGYVLAKRYTILMIPATFVFLIWYWLFKPTAKTVRLLGLLIPSGIYAILTFF
jgi:hypothetical protein